MQREIQGFKEYSNSMSLNILLLGKPERVN